MTMSKVLKKITPVLVAAALAACGGGGDEPASPLAGYLGNWGLCNGSGRMDRVLITQDATDTSVQIKQEITFHAKADCSDSAGATLYFLGASTAASKTGTLAGNLALPGTTARMVTADQFNAVTTGGALRVVSSGLPVEYLKTSNTRGQWCINGVAGQNYCLYEDDESMESGDETIGLYHEGQQLFTFQQNEKTGPFTLSGSFTRL